MDKVAVGAIGSAALAIAIAISVVWGRLDQSYRGEGGQPIARAFRRLAIVEVSGIVAGLLVGGLGSRLMMRIMAATSPVAAQGRQTEAGEIVGRVTSDGTGGLIIFVGLGMGLFGAVLYLVLARFLPKPAWAAGGVLGLFVLGIFARRDPLSPHNRDFEILSPVLLAVAIIVLLFLLYGTTVVALAARLERFYPRFDTKSVRTALAVAPLILLVPPPFTLALVGAGLVGALHAQFPKLASFRFSEETRRIGFALIVVATVLGNVWLGFGLAEIL